MKKAYISIDVEASGLNMVEHSVLSIGASLIVQERATYSELFSRGLVFYAELKPTSLKFFPKAMEFGASQLECLDAGKLVDGRFDTKNPLFDPLLVLQHMQSVCTKPSKVMADFAVWISRVAEGKQVEGVADTVFFDAGLVQYYFAQCSIPSPFGWEGSSAGSGGLDIDSLYRGYAGAENANLRGLGLKDTRVRPHHAGHDAVFQGDLASELFAKMGWWE
jgi:hypothetical protein